MNKPSSETLRQASSDDPRREDYRYQQPQNEELAGQDLDLVECWRIVKRRKRSIIIITLLGLLIGLLSAFSVTPVYRAEATLLVEPAQPKFVSLSQLNGVTPVNLFYETQYEVIRSRSINEAAVNRLSSQTRLALLQQAVEPGGGLLEWLPKSWRQWIQTTPEKIDSRIQQDALVKQIQGHLNVHGGKQSQIIILGFDAENPFHAAEIANAITQAYIEHGMESRMSTVKQAADWMSGRLADLKIKFDKSESLRQAYQAREEMVDTENSKRIITARLTNLATELVKAQTARSEAEIRYHQIEEIKKQGLGYDALIPILKNQLLLKLAEELARLDRKRSELSERYGHKHPKMIAATTDRDEARRILQLETEKVIENLRKEYEAALAKEQESEDLIAGLQQEMRQLSGKAFQLEKLEREVETNRQLYESFRARLKEVDVTADDHTTNVQIIDQAKPPTEPFKPNRKLIIFLSSIIGLFIAFTVTFVHERLDNTFRKAEDIEDKLLLPVFALLPRLAKMEKQELLPERWMLSEPHSTFAEAINNIRTGVMFSSIDTPIKTLLVTSALPGEGKTTLSSNLAISFSQMGQTLLMDTDMRHPSIEQVLKLRKPAGLSECILGKSSVQECIIQDVECDTLFILPSGVVPPNPLELLSTRRFREIFRTLSEEFEYIILDTPPVLPASDAIVLAHLVDGIILSIKADETTHESAIEMLKRFTNTNITPLGAVLSLADLRKQESYYGGEYYGATNQ